MLAIPHSWVEEKNVGASNISHARRSYNYHAGVIWVGDTGCQRVVAAHNEGQHPALSIS